MVKKKECEPARELHAEINIITDDPLPETNQCFERLREVYAMAKITHGEIYQALRAVQQKQATLSLSELVDCQFALRESAKLLDDIRKECEETQKAQANLTVAMWAMESLNNGGGKDVIQGTFCSGSPDLKTRAAIPKWDKEPERYEAMMRWLGIPEDLWDKGTVMYADTEQAVFETEVVKVNYNGWQSYMAAMVHNGYPLPDFVIDGGPSATWTESTVRITKHRDLI